MSTSDTADMGFNELSSILRSKNDDDDDPWHIVVA